MRWGKCYLIPICPLASPLAVIYDKSRKQLEHAFIYYFAASFQTQFLFNFVQFRHENAIFCSGSSPRARAIPVMLLDETCTWEPEKLEKVPKQTKYLFNGNSKIVGRNFSSPDFVGKVSSASRP